MDQPRPRATRMKETNRKPNQFHPGFPSLVANKVKNKTVKEGEEEPIKTREMVRLKR